MQLVIIAGGKGTRLGLQDIPKSMVEINGKPLLLHQIELARRYDLKDIFILSGHLSEIIVDFLENGKDFGVNITHIIEPYPLGTAGSVKLLEHIIKDRFMVFYGDVVMDFDLESFINFDKKLSPIGTVIVHPNDHPYDSDLIEINKEGLVTAFHSKPHLQGMYYKNLVNAAVYILSPDIFKYIPFEVSSDFGKDIFPKLINEGEIISTYKSAEYIKDMGTLDRLDKVTNDVLNGKVARFNKERKRAAIFMDRDGVINKDTDNLSKIEDFNLLDKVPEAINLINKSEYLSIVVTNQPMIAKGFLNENELYSIHKKMETMLGNKNVYVNDIYYCPHHPDAGFEGEIKELKIKCNCRKPNPGMFLQAAKDYNIDLANSWMIGDRSSDMFAGKKAGCKTILLAQDKNMDENTDYCCNSLFEAVKFILGVDYDYNKNTFQNQLCRRWK